MNKTRVRIGLFKYQKGKCAYCLQKMTLDKVTIDHITPKSKGGKDTLSNLLLAHSKCNTEKGDQLIKPKIRPVLQLMKKTAITLDGKIVQLTRVK